MQLLLGSQFHNPLECDEDDSLLCVCVWGRILVGVDIYLQPCHVVGGHRKVKLYTPDLLTQI